MRKGSRTSGRSRTSSSSTRILERMCRLCVVEPAAVAGDQLDGFLAGDRSTGDGLLSAAQGGDDLIMKMEVLDYPAGKQHDRTDESDRQQNAQRAPDHIHPEIAKLVGFLSGKPAH